MSENENKQVEEQELDINHLIQVRREKLEELQANGNNPFEITKFDRTNTSRRNKRKI